MHGSVLSAVQIAATGALAGASPPCPAALTLVLLSVSKRISTSWPGTVRHGPMTGRRGPRAALVRWALYVLPTTGFSSGRHVGRPVEVCDACPTNVLPADGVGRPGVTPPRPPPAGGRTACPSRPDLVALVLLPKTAAVPPEEPSGRWPPSSRRCSPCPRPGGPGESGHRHVQTGQSRGTRLTGEEPVPTLRVMILQEATPPPGPKTPTPPSRPPGLGMSDRNLLSPPGA